MITLLSLSSSSDRSHLRWLRHPITAAFVLLAFLSWNALKQPASVPVDAVLQSEARVNEKRCAECHHQAKTFPATGHARTLTPVTQPESLGRLLKFADSSVSDTARIHLEQIEDRVRAVHSRDGAAQYVDLDWCFGSGRHAQTWVGTLEDSWGCTDLIEFRWSWYHSIEDFAVTPGQETAAAGGYFGELGVLYDQPKALRCFACHASYLPVDDGHLIAGKLEPGVTCQRCHGPQQQHVESDGAIVERSWKGIDQMESVNRCAQCHRRADEQKPEDITRDNVSIVRFQPVGLVQSSCFTNSDMTCLTCHDPHLPLETQDSLGIWQCLQCHDVERDDQTPCSAGHSDNCLSCHMPKVRMTAPTWFTDHWIRIRSESEAQP